MTWAQKHRLLGAFVFMFLLWSLPDAVFFYRWITFAMTVIFWLLVSAAIAVWLMSVFTDYISDD